MLNEININEAGFALSAVQITSPNFDARPALFACDFTSENKGTQQSSAHINEAKLAVLAEPEPTHQGVISMIVIHNISLPPNQYGGSGIIELFTNTLNPEEHPYYAEIYTRRVSSHFLIRRDGELIQFVSCLQRAWHAGVSQWQARERCNDFSVGIELEGSDFEAFEPQQYAQLQLLIHALKIAYPIDSIVGHSMIAPGRKTDPGPYFDWGVLNNLTDLKQ